MNIQSHEGKQKNYVVYGYFKFDVNDEMSGAYLKINTA